MREAYRHVWLLTRVVAVSATLTIPEVAELLGVSRNSAYQQAKTGEIVGVPVLRMGKRLLGPRKPFLQAVGELEGEGGDSGNPPPSPERV